jgi:hypothetical protein
MVNSRTETPRLRIIPTVSLSVIFAQAGADKTLPAGTVVAFNTSSGGYVEWATGGANGTGDVQGIIFPDPVDITDAGEVSGVVMFKGEAARGDLVSDGGTGAQLTTALTAPAVLAMGLVIRNLADAVQQ